jgi:hypothetical protein
MQSLWNVQQKRDYCSGLIPVIRKGIFLKDAFLRFSVAF